MNTNYDSEATFFQNPEDEATQFENTTSQQSNDETSAPSTGEAAEAKTSKQNMWKRMATGAGSGLLIGSVATVLMGMDKPGKHDELDDNNGEEKQEGNHREVLTNPDWVDNDIAVATCVNEDMSFGEAFAAARAEVGPGGCFEWHGNVYGTYTAEEWNSMTADQRAEWSDHFSWNHIDHSHSNVAQHSTTAHTSSSTSTAQVETDDDIEIVSVEHSETNHVAQTGSQDGITQTSGEVEVEVYEPEIEVIVVVHDEETNANIAGMTVDGQEVILIDVNNDMIFDYMGMDVDGNGQIDQHELVDFQDQNLSVNDLGGFSNPTGNYYADNDGPDYSNDVAYEC